jgi:dihydroorotate dehydrogenase electron transfer subunit
LYQVDAKVINQAEVIENHFILKIFAPEIVKEAIPGQFIMLSAWSQRDPLLRRPFTFNRIFYPEGSFELLYKKVGKGTEIMSYLKPNDQVSLLGPLGNGIKFTQNMKKIAIVSRGIGVAPMLAIVDSAKEKGIEVYAYLSAATENLLLRKEEIKEKAKLIYITTDDASLGAGGKVTDFLAQTLIDTKMDAVYTCGSKRLKNHIESLKETYGFKAWVILEEHMACGIGACKGCICRAKKTNNHQDRYLLVCKDGPVFPVDEVEV